MSAEEVLAWMNANHVGVVYCEGKEKPFYSIGGWFTTIEEAVQGAVDEQERLRSLKTR